ncbi:MAG: hypothetical protein ACREJN_04290 [Nitrospiraceae bacterium]
MPSDPIRAAVTATGHLRFSTNFPFIEDLEQAGGRVVRQPTGHLIFYRSDGRRFLATDPEGNPLHECEWGTDVTGNVILCRARVRLDWDRWVGLKPAGLLNEVRLNLASKPGWQRLKADDLRAMAVQALRVTIEDVRFFYRDADLLIEPTGRATIRQRKDALYVLQEGDFEQASFMACMGAMNWPSIDFLPVVELFKSLLPGTGSAVFELIRGLYDDQNEGNLTPRPLRYRGIPSYPSEAAFRLFSSFFAPQVPGGNDPFTLFMNRERSDQVIWLPAATTPVRYFHQRAGACLTFQDNKLLKVTEALDSSGLSYVSSQGRRFVPFDRSAEIVGEYVILKDRDREVTLAVPLPQGSLKQTGGPVTMSPVDWRSVFVREVPTILPTEAYGAVLLYPEDASEISECSAQPFVADYLQDVGEQDREIGAVLSRAERVLIENGDAVVATCITFDRLRDYTVLVRYPAYAQKQAQQLWSICSELQRWDWLRHMRFASDGGPHSQGAHDSYDLIYHWVPYGSADVPSSLADCVKGISQMLRSGGHAFVIGPAQLGREGLSHGLHICWKELVEQLPTFRMHCTILPNARLRAGLTLFHMKKV